MFWKVFRMDLKRCFSRWKFAVITVLSALLLFISEWDDFDAALGWTPEMINENFSGIDFLMTAMQFDAFKVVIVVLLSGIYAGSFCRDESNHYLRMVLFRTDIYIYTWSKFLTNLLVILTASIAACFLCIITYMAFSFPLLQQNTDGGSIGAAFYREIIIDYPVLYVVMIGLQFGMVAAACSCAGLLFSAYQANTFVTIGLSGFLFLVSMSLLFLNGTPFDVLNLVGMQSVLPGGQEASRPLMFAWGMLYPGIVIIACAIKFERRMKWRIVHGII